MKTARAAVGVCVGALACAIPGALCWAVDPPEKSGSEEPPPVFSKLTLDEALTKVKGTDQVVVVDFMASWCGPCKTMDRTSWRDPKVVDWVKANGVAVQLDVDKSRDVAAAQHITAMPTILVFHNGDLVDRRVGMMPAGPLLAMLDAAKKGEKPADKAPADVSRMSMQDRLSAAETLSRDGKFEDATKEFLWLWNNMTIKEPAMVGVRGSFMAGAMKELAQSHKPARAAFAAERDQLTARLKTDQRTFKDLDDWIVLNDVVGDQDATLAWFDRIKHDVDAGPTLDRESFRLERILEERGRWADLGKMQRDPVGKLRQAHALWAMMPPMPNADAEMRKEMAAMHAQQFRDQAGTLYAGQLAAGRDDKAAAVADEAVKLDSSGQMRLALVERALQAGQVRRSMLDQLKDAQNAGADADALRAQVLKALGEAAG